MRLTETGHNLTPEPGSRGSPVTCLQAAGRIGAAGCCSVTEPLIPSASSLGVSGQEAEALGTVTGSHPTTFSLACHGSSVPTAAIVKFPATCWVAAADFWYSGELGNNKLHQGESPKKRRAWRAGEGCAVLRSLSALRGLSRLSQSLAEAKSRTTSTLSTAESPRWVGACALVCVCGKEWRAGLERVEAARGTDGEIERAKEGTPTKKIIHLERHTQT